MASCNVTLKRPHFFQMILEENPGKRLWIPRRFMRVYGHELSSHVKVKDANGKKWIMVLSKRDGETYFEKGWQEFADYYYLKHGHVLVFKYKGSSCFSLVILDKTATEIAYPIERASGNVQKLKRVAMKGSIVPSSDASAPSLPKKRKESSAEDFKGLSHRGKVAEKNSCKRNSDLIAEVEVTDPDFKDFEEDRKEQCFKVGQVWAVYDPRDGMPRRYARITKIFHHGIFTVKVTWLEANPDKKHNIKWVERGLPTSCGTFKHGTTDYLDRLMFSHLMVYEKGNRRNTCKIFPRKGETWAVFKNEYMPSRYYASISEGYFEYDFVEILTEYREGVGVFVAYLSKMMGFVSIFCRAGNDRFLIADDDLYRFSHKVPSLKLIGNGKFSVPNGAFELDPGSLPSALWTIKEIYYGS